MTYKKLRTLKCGTTSVTVDENENIVATDTTHFIAGKHCSECQGYGQTDSTRTVMRQGDNGKTYTHLQGSGCPKCLGTGLAA